MENEFLNEDDMEIPPVEERLDLLENTLIFIADALDVLNKRLEKLESKNTTKIITPNFSGKF